MEVWIYNPTYGSLQVKDLNDTLKEEDHWVQSYVSSDRPLKECEKKLLCSGKMGYYPDEFYLVDKLVSKELVQTHLEQIKAFSARNQNGPEIEWKDTLGNEETRLRVAFVPGPIVDLINQTENSLSARYLFEMMLEKASSLYRNKRCFQKCAQKHSWDVILAVRTVADFPSMRNKIPWLYESVSQSVKCIPTQKSLFDFAGRQK